MKPIPEIWETHPYRDFTGGENLKLWGSAPNQAITLQNCVLSNNGIPETRLGKVAINATLGAGGITAGWRFAKENGTKYIVVQHGTKIYATTWDGVTLPVVFGASIKTVNAAKLRGRVWKDRLFLSNGVDNFFYFDGTTCTDLSGSPPKTAIFTVYSGRLWAVDIAKPNSIRWCGLEDYNTWDVLDVTNVRDGDGDRLTALAPVPGGMILFKQNMAYPLYGNSRTDLQIGEPISRYAGCVSTDSLIDAGLVLGKDNLYKFDLSSVTPWSDTHTPLFNSMTIAQKQTAHSGVHPITKRVVVFLNDNAQQTLCIHGEYGGAITSWANINAGCFFTLNAKDDSESLLMGDKTNGIVYLYQGDKDGSSDIQTRIKTIYNDQGKTREKHWRNFIPEIDLLEDSTDYRTYLGYDIDYRTYGGMLSASWSPNFLNWGIDKWRTATWGIGARSNEPQWLDGARGRRISFEFIASHRVRFYGYTTKFREVGPQL